MLLEAATSRVGDADAHSPTGNSIPGREPGSALTPAWTRPEAHFPT